jgi:hypothetical protein
MKTVQRIKNDLGNEYTEYIVSMDHNVPDHYDQEFSIHMVCRPSITDNDNLKLNEELKLKIKKMSEDFDIAHKGFHIHVTLEIRDEILGIKTSRMEVKSD